MTGAVPPVKQLLPWVAVAALLVAGVVLLAPVLVTSQTEPTGSTSTTRPAPPQTPVSAAAKPTSTPTSGAASSVPSTPHQAPRSSTSPAPASTVSPQEGPLNRAAADALLATSYPRHAAASPRQVREGWTRLSRDLALAGWTKLQMQGAVVVPSSGRSWLVMLWSGRDHTGLLQARQLASVTLDGPAPAVVLGPPS